MRTFGELAVKEACRRTGVAFHEVVPETGKRLREAKGRSHEQALPQGQLPLLVEAGSIESGFMTQSLIHKEHAAMTHFFNLQNQN